MTAEKKARVTRHDQDRTAHSPALKGAPRRALSIRQPWAHAILHLIKDVENRPWRTNFRGPLLIQASLKVERDEATKLGLDPDELTTGAIVGQVEVVDCIQDSKSKWASPGQWHWVLKDPRMLKKAVPCW